MELKNNHVRNSTILVADDEPAILKFLVAYLETKDFTMIAAEDGESALRKFDESSPDMVITDISMPGMSGEVVCKKIREKSDVPIIVMTGQDAKEEWLRLLDIGVNDYLGKPFQLNELVQKVQISLNRGSVN